MSLRIRLFWTAALVIAIAWPLLFWGKAASLDRVDNARQPVLLNPMERHDILW